jgi:hypothetical protein
VIVLRDFLTVPSRAALFAFLLLPSIVFGAGPRTILYEDFQSYTNTQALKRIWGGGTGELLTDSPGGGNAVIHDGGEMNKYGGFSVTPDEMHNIVLTGDFYDFATNTEKRVTVCLRNQSGSEVSFGLNGPAPYVLRVVGFGSTTNWVSFHRGQRAVEGWHRFRAVISTTNIFATLDLKRDGKIDRKVNLELDSLPPKLTQLRIGGLSNRPSHGGPVLIDNIKLEVVPVEAIVAKVADEKPVISAPPAIPPPGTAVTVLTNLTAAALTNAPLQLTNRPLLTMVETQATLPLTTAPTAVRAPVFPARADPAITAAAWWILGALGVIIVLLGGLVIALSRQSKAVPSAPGTALVPIGAGADWQRRALEAEAIASKQAKILGEKVGPELVEFAKQSLVQGLYSQRNVLMETQRRAQDALAELELRLGELHLPVQERIQVYEKRITELEKELETRGDEMRELTRATLLLVREKLEQERRTPRFN